MSGTRVFAPLMESSNTPSGHFGSTLIVPIDGTPRSERIVSLAAKVSRLVDADIEMVSIVDDDEDKSSRLALMEEMAKIHPDGEHPIRSVVRVSPYIAGSLTDSVRGDMSAVMATGATIGLHDGHVGSIAESVVRSSGRPGVLVGPNATASLEGVDRLVVPVDGSSLSESVLGPAAQIGRLLDVPVWVVTVLTPHMVEMAAGFGVDVVMETGYVRRLAALLRDTGVNAQYDVLHRSSAADAVLDFAGPTGMCVMATHGRGGVARVVMGSVATRVVRYASVPTVVVPPTISETMPPEETD